MPLRLHPKDVQNETRKKIGPGTEKLRFVALAGPRNGVPELIKNKIKIGPKLEPSQDELLRLSWGSGGLNEPIMRVLSRSGSDSGIGLS